MALRNDNVIPLLVVAGVLAVLLLVAGCVGATPPAPYVQAKLGIGYEAPPHPVQLPVVNNRYGPTGPCGPSRGTAQRHIPAFCECVP